MPLQTVTPPTAEPLDISVVRQHVKQDITDDDDLLQIAIGSARRFAEMLTQRQFVAARLVWLMDSFPVSALYGAQYGRGGKLPESAILLPKSPVIQVVSITYTDMGGVKQTMPATDYVVDLTCEPARITPVFGKVWPINLPQINSVQVTFDAGYMTPAVFDSTANTVTVKGWRTMAVGDNVRLSNSGGLLPAAVTAKTDYYVQAVVSPGMYALSASPGGPVIDFTDVGTGISFLGQPGLNNSHGELEDGIKSWMFLRVDSLYSHRGETANTRGNIVPLPWVDRLLDPYKVVLA